MKRYTSVAHPALMAVTIFYSAEASSQERTPAPPVLRQAVLHAVGPEGWRTERLPNGRIAAIGIGGADGKTFIVGIACAEQAPQLVGLTRNGDAPVGTLIAQISYSALAFPIGATLETASSADALVSDAMLGEDAQISFQLGGNSFSAKGARNALGEVAKDCKRVGWDYGNDDRRQMVWIANSYPDEAPALLYGKPWSGWLLAAMICDTRDGSLVVKSTAFPRRAKNDQRLTLTISVGEQRYSADGRVERYQEGDVAGLAIAKFDRPQKMLADLSNASWVSIKAATEELKVPTAGLSALLPSFQTTCGLK